MIEKSSEKDGFSEFIKARGSREELVELFPSVIELYIRNMSEWYARQHGISPDPAESDAMSRFVVAEVEGRWTLADYRIATDENEQSIAIVRDVIAGALNSDFPAKALKRYIRNSIRFKSFQESRKQRIFPLDEDVSLVAESGASFEEIERFFKAFDQIEPAHRFALKLRFRGHKQEDAAAQMEIPLRTYQRLVFEAKKQLRAVMGVLD